MSLLVMVVTSLWGIIFLIFLMYVCAAIAVHMKGWGGR